jgi:membrane fusion protein (multidrug efflux system)
MDIDTGMYQIDVDIENDSGLERRVLVLNAHTDTLQDVINVPKSVLKKDDTGTYLWKIDDGKAVKAYVDVSSQNGYGAVISNGVKAGDLVVMTGQSRLREGDLVKVVHEGNAVPEGCGS